ncbi:MAG: protease modulator HflC [Gammaproteobacteria bacterium]|nr:protease modulator HflC [Gammaproteobacteria bacterium]
MSNKSLIGLLLTIIVLAIVNSSIFVLTEGTRGLVRHFGKVERDANDKPVIYAPGIHFKIPIADNVIVMDVRMQTLDGEPNVFTTVDKEFLEVNTYVQWKVTDFSQFYLSTNGQFRVAGDLLERLVDNGLRDQFGQRTLKEAISEQREELMHDIKSEVNLKTPKYGIEVIDIRVKKINYPSEVASKVYERMKSERVATSTKIKTEGEKKGNIIKSEADKKVQEILSEGDQRARTIKGQADAEAAKIYADTYNKDPEFYAFLRSLDAYKASFNSKDDIIVIKPDSDFFKYFKDSKGKK